MGVVVAVGLVLWLAILSLDHTSPSAAATVSTKAKVRHTAAVPLHAAPAPMASGTTCFVDGQQCSEIPCTELIRSTVSVANATATLIAPSVRGPRLETPVSGCGARHPLPHAIVVTPRQGPIRQGPRHGLAPYSVLLANMAHRLAAHPPTRP